LILDAENNHIRDNLELLGNCS